MIATGPRDADKPRLGPQGGRRVANTDDIEPDEAASSSSAEIESPPRPAESSGSSASTRAERLTRGGRRRHRPRDRSGDLFLFLVIAGLVLLFFLVEPQQVVTFMMDPKVGVFLLVLVVEYLILKSVDRTRVYQMENTRLREQKRADHQTMKRAREVIEEGMRDDTVLTPDAWSKWRAKADSVRNDLKQKL